ncbi:MAG: hypothetical protein JWP50_1176 [Phenylobacterium sp.]|nr:hypothetical protein [Phenylobacterium sp.]
MLIVMLASAALLAETTPAAAQAAAPAAAPGAAVAAAKPVAKAGNDVVCHKEAILGSNIPRKVCFSKAEYEANRTESRANVEHIQVGAPMVAGH